VIYTVIGFGHAGFDGFVTVIVGGKSVHAYTADECSLPVGETKRGEEVG